MTDKRIVFMGTPDFAAHCLSILIESGFNLVGVVTVADKPAGRGQQIQESAVKKVALHHGLPILQPEKLKSQDFLENLRDWQADLFVVIAFRMLPEVVWKMPPLGSINLHGSLLPQFRGAAPINHALMSGEKETGVTTFFIEQEIDKGNILLQEQTAIGKNETAGELHDRLMKIGAKLMVKTLSGVLSGKLQAIPQNKFDLSEIKHAPKIFKADCEINWQHSAHEVHDFIRGLSPYPAAWTTLFFPESKTVKIFRTQVTAENRNLNSLEVYIDKDKLFVQCGERSLEILELQVEGKKRVQTSEFVRGLRAPITLK